MKFKLLHFISFIFVCAVFFCAAQQASACTCPNFSEDVPLKEYVKTAKADATAVFSGEVVSFDPVMVAGTGVDQMLPDGKIEFILPQYEQWAAFKVTDVWKGSIGSEIKIRIRGTGCDFSFEVGKAYLVYAYGKMLETNICSRTALVDAKNTGKEIKILNKLKE